MDLDTVVSKWLETYKAQLQELEAHRRQLDKERDEFFATMEQRRKEFFTEMDREAAERKSRALRRFERYQVKMILGGMAFIILLGVIMQCLQVQQYSAAICLLFPLGVMLWMPFSSDGD